MTRLLIACFIFIHSLLFCACVSKDAIQKDLTAAREHAFQEWSAQKLQKSKKEPIIHGKLSLDDALELALSHNRALQVVLEEKNVAKGRILESYGEVLPNLSLNGKYTRKDSDSKNYKGQTYSGQLDNYSGILSVKQPIFRGGAATAALRASRYYDTLTDENVREAVQNTIHETVRTYYLVSLTQEQYRVTKTYADLADAHLKDVKIKKEFGTASDFNVLRSQVELSNARAEMISYQNKLHRAITSLLKTMGMSQESRIELTDLLTYEPLSVEEEEVIRKAFLNRPDLAAAELTMKMQEESLNKAYSEYWPKIDAFYNQSLSKPDPYLSTKNDWGDSWKAGIEINIPIFDGLKREGRVAQERAALKQQHIWLLDTREKALFEVRNAVLNLRDATEFVDVQKLTHEQAREGLRLAETGYREGTLDQVSVLDARAALTNANLLYYQSLYAHALTRLDLQKAMGTLGQKSEKEDETVSR